MGNFTVPIDVTDLARTSSVTVEAMVDTGAIYTLVPETALTGIVLDEPETREFALAGESVVEYTVCYARIRFEDREVISLLIAAPEGTTPLLGVTALEHAGLAVDPVNERLIPVRGPLKQAV